MRGVKVAAGATIAGIAMLLGLVHWKNRALELENENDALRRQNQELDQQRSEAWAARNAAQQDAAAFRQRCEQLSKKLEETQTLIAAK